MYSNPEPSERTHLQALVAAPTATLPQRYLPVLVENVAMTKPCLQ